MDMGAIISVVTAFITYVFGLLSKKFNWVEKSYIPVQNFAIGTISGVLVYALGLQEGLGTSIMLCLVSALGAGGCYDLTKTTSQNNE